LNNQQILEIAKELNIPKNVIAFWQNINNNTSDVFPFYKVFYRNQNLTKRCKIIIENGEGKILQEIRLKNTCDIIRENLSIIDVKSFPGNWLVDGMEEIIQDKIFIYKI